MADSGTSNGNTSGFKTITNMNGKKVQVPITKVPATPTVATVKKTKTITNMSGKKVEVPLPATTKVATPATPATPAAPVVKKGSNSGFPTQAEFNEGIAKVAKDFDDAANTPTGKAVSAVFGPIVSAAEFVLNAMQVGNAAMAGSDYKRIQQNQKGIITPDDIRTAAINKEKINGKVVKSKLVNGMPVFNIQPTVTDPAKIAEINASRFGAGATNATAFLRPGEKTVYGADIAQLKNPKIDPLEAAGQGIAYDLTHDPLLLVNPGKIIKALKPAVTAANQFVKGINAAKNSGEFSQDVVKKAIIGAEVAAGKPLEEAIQAVTKTPTLTPIKKTGIPENLQGRGGKAAEVQADAELQLKKNQILRVKLSPEELAAVKDASGITNPILASALDAAKKAYTQVAVSQQTTKFLEKFVKNEVSGIFKKAPTAVVHPDFAGEGGFKVLGGNGEELARTADRKSALEIAKGIKQGTAPQGEILPTPQLPPVAATPQAPVMTTREAIELAAQDGTQITLAKDVVHEATDGSSYLFDGSNLRKFASLEDAQTYVRNTSANLVEEAKVLQDGEKWVVRQGDSISTYSSEAKAVAAAKKINTGQTTPARITTGAPPVAAEAAKPAVSVLDVIKLRPTDAEGKAAQDALTAAQKAATEAVGTQVGIKAADRATLRELIQSKTIAMQDRILGSEAAKKALESIRLASRLDGYNPVALRESLAYGDSEAKRALLRLIDATPVVTGAGEKATLGELLNVKAWKANAYPAATLKNMLEALEGIAERIATAGKTSPTDAKYAQIEKTFGKDIADKVKATGILDAKPSKEAMSKYLALENQLEAASKTVKYESFDDVMAGLASGDSISAPDLAKIIRALDPSKKILKQVDDAVDKNDAEFLKNVLSGEGVQSINAIQKKILYTADFSNMLKVEGIGYDDVLSTVFADSASSLKAPALTPNPDSILSPEFIRAAEASESPEAFANVLRSSLDGDGDIATEAMNSAFRMLGANLDEIVGTRGSLETVSLYGDVTNRVSKKAWVGRAALPEQINQVFDAKVASVINGIARDRYSKAKKTVAPLKDYLFEETIKEFDKVSAALGLIGVRIQRNKIVTALTKKTGDPKNLVYLHTGDIFKAFDATNGRSIIQDAFYSGGKDFERNSFLHQNLGEGARYVLEQDAAGAPIDMAKLVGLVQNGIASPSLTPTKAFLDKMPAIAERLAAHLASPAVIKEMKEAHLTKSIGLANRVINQSHSVAQDIFATLWDSIRLNALNGDLSVADTVKLLRTHLNKLATAGKFFDLQSGPMASAAFRSWSQILTLRGKVDGVDLLDKQEWNNFRTALNKFSETDKAASAVEQTVLVPKHTILNAKQQAAFLKKENIQIQKAQDEIIRGRREDIAAQLSDEVDAGAFDNMGIPEEDVPGAILQAMHDRGIKEDTQWGIPHMNPQLEAPVMQLRTIAEGSGFKKLTKTNLYGFENRQELKAIGMQLETATFRVASQFARYFDDLRIKYGKLDQAGFDAAIDLLRLSDGITDDVIKNTDPAVLAFYNDLKPAIDLLFGSKESNGFIDSGITGKAFQNALSTVGIGANAGIPNVSNYAAEDMWQFFKDLPLGSRPKDGAGTGEIAEWATNRAAFEDSDMDALLLVTRVMQAAAAAKYQTGLSRGVASRFGHLAHGLTAEQATAKGYVRIAAGDGGSNLMIESIPEGTLFPPNIAEQLGYMMRDWDYQFKSPTNRKLQTIMQLTGMVKAAQTILNLGHHINNWIGTSTTLMLRGVTNPTHYAIGFRLAGKHFAEKVATDWRTKQAIISNSDVTARKLEQLYRASGFEGRILEKPVEGMDFGQFISVIENGKKVNYSDEDIMKAFEDSGIFEESIYQQDIVGLQDNLFTDSRALGEAGLINKIKNRDAMVTARKIERKITRGPGDISAAHGNVLRVTQAMHILQSRSWKNLQEGIDAAVKELAIYQPTSKSLTPFERKYGRLATSYYTWMRMAQLQTVRIFLENNRNMNIAQDLLYNINAANGYTPQNTGTAYPDKTAVPSYLSSKSGGLLLDGQVPSGQVPLISQPALVYNDVFNFWGMQVDLSRPIWENIIGINNGRPVGIIPQLAIMPAKNLAIAAQPIYKAIFQQNPSTGVGLDISTPMDFFDEFVAPLTGGPGQTVGAIANLGNDANKSFITIINKLTGQKLAETNTPKIEKSRKLEQSIRYSDWLKNTGQK